METETTRQRLVHKFGERAGIGVIAIFAIVFLSFQNPEQAASNEIVQAQISDAPTEEKIVYKLENYPQVTESTPTPLPEDEPTPTSTPSPVPTKKTSSTTVKNTPTPIPTVALLQENAPIPTHTPTPTQAPAPEAVAGQVEASNDAIWDQLAACEAGGNWAIDTGNGYFGGLQFSQGAWESVGGTGNPAHATREEQIEKGKALQQRRGWGAWGMCAVKLGLN